MWKNFGNFCWNYSIFLRSRVYELFRTNINLRFFFGLPSNFIQNVYLQSTPRCVFLFANLVFQLLAYRISRMKLFIGTPRTSLRFLKKKLTRWCKKVRNPCYRRYKKSFFWFGLQRTLIISSCIWYSDESYNHENVNFVFMINIEPIEIEEFENILQWVQKQF